MGDGRKKLFDTEFIASHEDIQMDEKQERDLVEAKSNEIVEGLLWRYYRMYESVSDDFESTHYSLRRLEVMHYELKQLFKEKEKERLKIKEYKETIDTDESSQNDESLTEEEYNLLYKTREQN